jgi:hypothetical protein
MPHKHTTQEIPYGYCHCGCGQLTSIALQSSTKHGYVRGEPKHFVIGHRARLGKYPSAEVAFWSHVTPGAADDCWRWHGPLNGYGYGLAQWIGSRRWRAHRLSYYLHFGPIPDDIQVLHKCDNPPCVNPNHLFLGTISNNMQDKTSKGRQMQGEQVPSSKLTDDDVRLIRSLAANGILHRVIAHQFNLTRSAITNIVNRRSWQHIK